MGGRLDLTTIQIALLCLAAFTGGTIDAIAGGGGLITVPALLAVGLPPHAALGTNKGQSVFGSFAAIVRYTHAGLIDGRISRISVPLGILGSLGGASLALLIRPEVLRPLVLVLLVAAAIVIGSGRVRLTGSTSSPRPHLALWIAGLALVTGAYDGFFGPGTGTFIIAGYVAIAHLALARASAEAKVLNFASNLTALVLFALHGAVFWRIALPMAAAQLAGGYFGAHLTVARGDRVVRVVAIAVVSALLVKIAIDMVRDAGLTS